MSEAEMMKQQMLVDANQTSDAAEALCLYKSPAVEISYLQSAEILLIKWFGQQTLATTQTGCLQLLQLLEKLRVHKVINDSRLSVGSWHVAIPWVVFHFLPLARKSGLRRAAHVISYNRASQLSADSGRLLMDFVDWDIEVFRNIEHAKSWLSCG